jgi:hypothetical protein
MVTFTLEALATVPGVCEVVQTVEMGQWVAGRDEECFLVMCWLEGESHEAVRATYRAARRHVRIVVDATERMQPCVGG